jgi:hypothetical protein
LAGFSGEFVTQLGENMFVKGQRPHIAIRNLNGEALVWSTVAGAISGPLIHFGFMDSRLGGVLTTAAAIGVESIFDAAFSDHEHSESCGHKWVRTYPRSGRHRR